MGLLPPRVSANNANGLAAERELHRASEILRINMRSSEFIARMDAAKRRFHVIGSLECGVIVALDIEGRLYTVLNGEVVSRVNPAAIERGGGDGYANPGGDALWPAPEGTSLGYHYATGAWRVPPSIIGANYRVFESGSDSVTIRAEADLINARGFGVPALLERRIIATPNGQGLCVACKESIEYRGARTLTRKECLLAPWSLCQFDCGLGSEVVFPGAFAECVWDLYGPSNNERFIEDGLWHVRTGNHKRFQLGLSDQVPWIEFRDRVRRLSVRRIAEPLAPGLEHIDIADRPPDLPPDPRGVRYSIYSDAAGFMEIEAAGGMPPTVEKGTRLEIAVRTQYCLG